ncbi:MAG TPA: DNA repair protein RadA [Candidatus Saccharimonadales bacterium]|nr:DNA repair protein RadA [Candidatus Saccharimonadales bacterium]
MPKKESVLFVCSNCGATSSSWSGRCFTCGEWNTLVAESPNPTGIRRTGRTIDAETLSQDLLKAEARLVSGIGELDSVLGGGIVPGSVILLAGQPGIGKSTLLLQLANSLSAKTSVLYVSGEESIRQISLRASRLGVSSKKLKLATSNSTDDIVSTIDQEKFGLVVIDSIQSMACNDISSPAGSVSQITNSTQLLSTAAKAKNINTALVIVGHVTKEGTIAGPKMLEHLVDVVLQLEGDRYGGFKILRASKNRYGSTNEAGILEMVDNGFRAVDNPSKALLAERQISDGSIVLATIEGSRPLLVEVQALVNRTSYGYPKRTASGIDLNRLNLLVAMLERRTKLKLFDQDIYVNIVGGIKVNEPAADLAVCMAVASAAKGMKLSSDSVVFGEVGLSGEIRRVPFIDKRIAEAKKLGFSSAIGPSITGKQSIKYHGVSSIRAALNTFLGKE